MSNNTGFLQNFGGMIALASAGTILVSAFKVAGLLDVPAEKPPEKPVCAEKKDSKSGMNIYQSDCVYEKK